MSVRYAGHVGGCKKADVYELLKAGIVDGPAQVFTRYHEKNITHIRFHVYGKKGKLIQHR